MISQEQKAEMRPSADSLKKAREIVDGAGFVEPFTEGCLIAEIATALDAAKAERTDRARELPDLLDAIFTEWGCEDPRDAADDILKFLASPVGLAEYAENSRPSLTQEPKP